MQKLDQQQVNDGIIDGLKEEFEQKRLGHLMCLDAEKGLAGTIFDGGVEDLESHDHGRQGFVEEVQVASVQVDLYARRILDLAACINTDVQRESNVARLDQMKKYVLDVWDREEYDSFAIPALEAIFQAQKAFLQDSTFHYASQHSGQATTLLAELQEAYETTDFK